MKRITSAFLFIVFLTLTLSAQERRGMTPLDVANIQYVGSAIFADDGEHIAYTVRVQPDPLKENVTASYQLHIYNLETSLSTPYITRGSVRALQFRPGHESVTFLNKLEGDKTTSLYEISLTGGEARKIADFETSIQNYDWSPDGRTIVFVASEPSEKEENALPYKPKVYEENLTYNRAYLHDVTAGESTKFEVEGHVVEAEWSPDGNRLLMAIQPTPLVDDNLMEQKLYVVDRNSMRVAAKIDHAGKLGEFCWSPDGGQVAFIGGADMNDPIDGRLFVASASGGKPKMLMEGWEGKFESIEWVRPEYINFLASKGAETVHGTVSPKGVKNFTTETLVEGLAISQLDIIPEGSVAYVADAYNHPPELFVEMSETKSRQRLTWSNPWLDEIAFGTQEVVRYKAKDGLEIEGILIHPVDKQADVRYPLIVYVHGGPESHLDNGWITGYSAPGQVAAGKGYAVFYPNYRGSTGRGLEYTLTSQGDPAGKEFDDIVDGVDYLIGTGLVDGSKVGVTGGSYGGYATGWLSTKYTDRFAAGVMFVGISDKVSKWGTTDIPNEEYLVHARKWVYEDYDFFLKRSPIYYAGQCKTPLLIMHGEEDTRVHPSQSMELYRHVKSRTDTPVSLVFYPGEGHGNAKATARYDYNLRLLDWFDKYLKGEVDKS